MVRSNSAKAETAEKPPEIPLFLEDGHPNPEYFSTDDRGYEQFQAVLDERDLWSQYIGYLYRVAPRRTVTDKEARVTTFTSTLPIPEITRRYGGKKWTVYMNRIVTTSKGYRLVKKFQFDIEAAPLWQDDETPEEPAGKKAGASLGASADDVPMIKKLIEDVIAQRDRAVQDGKQFNYGDALKQALDLQHTGFKSAISSITGNVGAGDNAAINALTTLVSKLIEANTVRRDDPIQKMLLEKALEKQEPRTDDSFERLGNMLSLLKDLGVKIGPARSNSESGAAGGDWASVVQTLLERLPEMLDKAGGIIAQRAAMPPRIPAPPAMLPGTGSAAISPPRMGNAATPPAGVRPAAASPDGNISASNIPANQPAPAAPGPDTPSPEVADRIAQNQVKVILVRMLFNGDSGEDAAHYATMAHEPLALALCQALKNNPAELQDDPILAQALHHPNVMQFRQEFVGYFEESDVPSREREPKGDAAGTEITVPPAASGLPPDGPAIPPPR